MPTATRSAFLDQYGRYAKEQATLHEIRTFDDDCNLIEVIPVAAYRAMPVAEQRALQQLGSGAPCVDTEGKSNA